MAEKLLELIEKYEDEIERIDKYLEDAEIATAFVLGLSGRRLTLQGFVDDLNLLLNSNN